MELERSKTKLNYFSKSEAVLWIASVLLIVISFCIFDRTNYLTLAASLIGATSLILNAKGNPIGQVLTVVFSIMYGFISFSFAYYGEMITYLGMTAPMAILAVISWLRHPFKGNKKEVQVNKLHSKEILFMLVLTVLVTVGFYYILRALNTANLIPSTISVTTSFLAVYLTFRRSAFYAVAYAANDIVLIILWVMATLSDITYLSVVICFAMFLVNDIYGFISWTKMQKKQKNDTTTIA